MEIVGNDLQDKVPVDKVPWIKGLERNIIRIIIVTIDSINVDNRVAEVHFIIGLMVRKIINIYGNIHKRIIMERNNGIIPWTEEV